MIKTSARNECIALEENGYGGCLEIETMINFTHSCTLQPRIQYDTLFPVDMCKWCHINCHSTQLSDSILAMTEKTDILGKFITSKTSYI